MTNLLDEYLEISKNILKALDNEDYDLLDKLLDERREIIAKVDELSENLDINKLIEIMKIEELIKQEINLSFDKITNNLKNVKEQIQAIKSYSKGELVDSIYINKSF